MERKDWTLLALAAAKGEPLSPVQLQKSLFLLGKVHARRVGRRFYTFQPYHGLAVVTMAPHGRWSEYRASAEGVARSKAVRAEAPNAAVEYLERAVEWCRSLSFQQLVRAIYAKYPEFRQNSVFR
jgi:hypothetical protein